MQLLNLVASQLPDVKATAYGPVASGYVAVMKCLSLVNTDAATVRTANVYLKEAGGTSKRITPVELSIAAKAQYLSVAPFIIPAGGVLEWDASLANTIDGVLVGGLVEQSNVTGIGELMWTMARKTADQSKTADATLAADTLLSMMLDIGKTYAVRLRVFFDTTAGGDFKYRITGPGGSTVRRHAVRAPGGTAAAFAAVVNGFDVADVTLLGGGVEGYIEEEMVITAGASASLVFEWAQNAASGTTTVKRASYMEVLPI